MKTMQTKKHYLEGVIHEGTLDGRAVLTAWTTRKDDAAKKAEEFRVQGAARSRVFTDGRCGFRIVGFF